VRNEGNMRAYEAHILTTERTRTAGSPHDSPTTEERPADLPPRMDPRLTPSMMKGQ